MGLENVFPNPIFFFDAAKKKRVLDAQKKKPPEIFKCMLLYPACETCIVSAPSAAAADAEAVYLQSNHPVACCGG